MFLQLKKKVSISLSLNGSLDIICYCASYVRFGFFVGICVAYLLTHSVSNELQKCDSFILAWVCPHPHFSSPFLSSSTAINSHLLTAPHPNVLEIGTNFTASCMIINTTEVTSDDLYWIASETTVPKEQYTKVNNTTLNVTIQVSGENSEEWLFCRSRKVSNYVELHEADFVHAILLRKACEFFLMCDFICQFGSWFLNKIFKNRWRHFHSLGFFL